MQETFTHLGRVHQGQLPFPDTGDLRIDVGPPWLQLGDARAWIEFGAIGDLLEQIKDRHQA